MKIESAAGEFEFAIESLAVTGNDIVLSGKMGVWDAETTVTHEDVSGILRLMFRTPALWGWLLKFPLRALAGRRNVKGGSGNG